jgi:hypothetical protein
MAASKLKKPALSHEKRVYLKQFPNDEINDDCLYLAPDAFERDPKKIEEMAKRVNKELNNLFYT